MFKNIGIPEALIITVFSMAIVFVSLLAISYLIDLMRVCLNRKKDKSASEQKVVQNVVQKVVEEDDTELVAVITAAIAALTGTSTSGLVVRNIKRLPDFDSAWAKTGKVELMR